MRIKYESDKNEKVLLEFLKLISRNYFIPLAFNMLMLFFLFFVSANCVFRSIYEGFISVRLYEVLMIPLMIIPIVNCLQTIIMIYLGIHKISNGDYIIDRYNCNYMGSRRIYLSDNQRYTLKDFTKHEIAIQNECVDMISIINNYGTIIWKIGIPPLTNPELKPEELFVPAQVFTMADIPVDVLIPKAI